MNDWNFGKLQKDYIQNLTRCKNFSSKSDALYLFKIKVWRAVFFNSKIGALFFFHFKIWLEMKFLIQNHAF